MKWRRLLLKLSIPIQRWMQKIHRPEYKVRGQFYWKLQNRIRSGDVLLSREDWHLTNWFIPGFWKHAAIVSHDSVIEAVGEGVRSVILAEWILTKDYVLVLRPRIEDAGIAGGLAEFEVGKKYDFLFAKGSKEFYCSELVLSMLQKAHAGFALKCRMSKLEVLPDDFEFNVEFEQFDVIADSRIVPDKVRK